MASKSKPLSKVFISHATADKELVNAFVDLLRLGVDIPRERIFCTSLQGMRIPTGQSFVAFIREQIKDCKFVISIITPSYYESQFCMCELGATWVMEEKDFFPLLVPPLGYDDLKAVLHGVQSGAINDKNILSELHDRLRESLGLGQGATGNWEEKRDGFINSFAALQKNLKGATNVPFATFDKLNQSYESVQKTVQQKNEEITTLQKQVKDLQKCKDASQVADIMRAYSSEQEELDSLIEDFKTEKLPGAVIEALFFERRGQDWRPKTGLGTDDIWDPIDSAEQDGYLSVDDGEVSTRSSHPPIRRANEALDALDHFIRNVSAEFAEAFEDENDYELRIDNRQFWEEFLGL